MSRTFERCVQTKIRGREFSCYFRRFFAGIFPRRESISSPGSNTLRWPGGHISKSRGNFGGVRSIAGVGFRHYVPTITRLGPTKKKCIIIKIKKINCSLRNSPGYLFLRENFSLPHRERCNFNENEITVKIFSLARARKISRYLRTFSFDDLSNSFRIFASF